MPEAFRTPIVLFYFEEFSYREIADQMALPWNRDVAIGAGQDFFAAAFAASRPELASKPGEGP